MVEHIPYVVDYTDRQVDIELLQHIKKPVELQLVHVSNVQDVPKIVTGIEKMVQRYALLLLSSLNTMKFDAAQGTSLLGAMLGGMIFNGGQANSIFSIANIGVLRQMRDDDAKPDTYGVSPADERIATARLVDIDIDFTQSQLTITVKITTAAGADIVFVVPVAASR